MEQITSHNGRLYYGNKECRNADEAYTLFRRDYHESLGRNVYRRLNRLGNRKERVHEFGFVFSGTNHKGAECYFPKHSIRYWMGLVLLCYCRFTGVWEYRDVTDGSFDAWFDWAFSKGSRALRLARREKSGRTSKRLKTTFR